MELDTCDYRTITKRFGKIKNNDSPNVYSDVDYFKKR